MPETKESDALMKMASEAIIQEWKETCRAISEIATKLAADPRQLEHVTALQLQTANLEKLQSNLASAIAREDQESLLRGFAQRLTAIASEHGQSPIGQCAKQIHAQWKLAYPLDGDQTIEAVRKDVARAERKLTEELEHWSSSHVRKSDLDKQLEEVKKQASDAREPGDRIRAEDREVDLQGEIAEVVREMRIARDRVFSAAGPSGRSFDPTKDYRRGGHESPVKSPPVNTDFHGTIRA